MKENFSAVFTVLFSDGWAWEGMKRKAWERLAGFQKGWKTATLHWCSINLKFWLVAERITVEGKRRCGLLDAALKWLLQFCTTLKLHHSDGNPSVKKNGENRSAMRTKNICNMWPAAGQRWALEAETLQMRGCAVVYESPTDWSLSVCVCLSIASLYPPTHT